MKEIKVLLLPPFPLDWMLVHRRLPLPPPFSSPSKIWGGCDGRGQESIQRLSDLTSYVLTTTTPRLAVTYFTRIVAAKMKTTSTENEKIKPLHPEGLKTKGTEETIFQSVNGGGFRQTGKYNCMLVVPIWVPSSSCFFTSSNGKPFIGSTGQTMSFSRFLNGETRSSHTFCPLWNTLLDSLFSVGDFCFSWTNTLLLRCVTFHLVWYI